MMTSQNLDILRLKLAFRLEKNCQCIPAWNMLQPRRSRHLPILQEYIYRSIFAYKNYFTGGLGCAGSSDGFS